MSSVLLTPPAVEPVTQLYGGALASASEAQVLNGANAAAVQHADGAWEVLQFTNAELVGERTYQHSNLLRGQMGSDRQLRYYGANATSILITANPKMVHVGSGWRRRQRRSR